jgi:hypothetical protein
MDFSLQIAMASPVHADAKLSQNGTRNHLELVGQLSAARWDDLAMLSNPLQLVLATVFRAPAASIEQRLAFCGDLPLLVPSIQLRVSDADEKLLPVAALSVTDFIGGVVATASGTPLFMTQAADRPDVDAVIDDQRHALLEQVGGKVVKTKIILQSPHLDPLVVSGRWARLPEQDAAIVETEECIDGYADGFWRGQRSLYLVNRSGRVTHVVQYEERLFLEQVTGLCARNRLDARPRCTLHVRHRAEGYRHTYALRRIEFHGMERIAEAQPDFDLAAPASSQTEREAAMT